MESYMENTLKFKISTESVHISVNPHKNGPFGAPM